MFNYLEKRKKYLVYIPLLIYWIFLLSATSLPTHSVPTTGVNDKIEHFGAYLVLSFLLGLTLLFQNKSGILKNNFILFTLLFAASYAALDELHQLLIPGRQCEILDWTADFTGSVVGILLLLFLLKKFNYRRNPE